MCWPQLQSCFMQFVWMVRSGLWEDPAGSKDALRFVLTTSGGQCVMTLGMLVMLKWSALNSEHPPLLV